MDGKGGDDFQSLPEFEEMDGTQRGQAPGQSSPQTPGTPSRSNPGDRRPSGGGGRISRADLEAQLESAPEVYPEPPPYTPSPHPPGGQAFVPHPYSMPQQFGVGPPMHYPYQAFPNAGPGLAQGSDMARQFMAFQQFMGSQPSMGGMESYPMYPMFMHFAQFMQGMGAQQPGSGVPGSSSDPLTRAAEQQAGPLEEKKPLDSEPEAGAPSQGAANPAATLSRPNRNETARVEEMDVEEDREARGPQGLLVWDLPDISQDDLSYFFENKRKTGGGAVESVELDKKRHRAVIFFEEPEKVQKVLQKYEEKGSFVLKEKRIKVALHTPESADAKKEEEEEEEREEEREEEEEEEEAPCRTVEVKNFAADTSDDALELYVENPKKGGGPVQDLQILREEGRVLVTFEDPAVAAGFVERKHILGGQRLDVKLYTPPPPPPKPAPVEMYDDRLLLSAVAEGTSLDCLAFFLEAKIGIVPRDFIKGMEPGVFMVMFHEEPDVAKLQEVCRKVKVEGAWLQVEGVPVSRTVLVTSLNPTTSQDAVELYFEAAKKSGGGDVESVTMVPGENSCLVTFCEPQVAIRVCEKQDHKLDGANLQVSLYHVCLGRCLASQAQDVSQQQVYRDRVLLRGVSDKTTAENLNYFLEAKLNCGAQEFLCGEQSGVILVVFGSEPDIGKLKHVCRSTQLEGAQLVVEEVPISPTVLVKNLPASAAHSQDAIQLYFEAVKRSSGGDVTDVKMIPNKNSCLVSFKDPGVALRVSGKKHQMDGSDLEVSVFYPCLGVAGGSPLGDFRLPAPLELKGQDRYKLLYLKGSSSLTQAMQNELAEAHAQIRWPKKKSGTTVQFDCTLTPDMQGAARLANSWAETVQAIFLRYLNELVDLKQKKVNPALWSAVEENLSKVQVQSKEAVTLFVEKDEHLLIFAGVRHAVGEIATQVDKLVSSLEEEAERKKRETEESNNIKPNQSLLLKALKFPAKAESKHPGLSVEIQTALVTFRGLPDLVKKAQMEMFETLNAAGSQDVGEFTKEQLSWLDGADNKRRLVEQFRAEKVVAVWEVAGSKVTLLASNPHDAVKAAGILKKTLMDAADPPRPNPSSQATRNPDNPWVRQPPLRQSSAAYSNNQPDRGTGGSPKRPVSQPPITSNQGPRAPVQIANRFSPLMTDDTEENREQTDPEKRYRQNPQRSSYQSGAGAGAGSSLNTQRVTLAGGLVVAPYTANITKLKVCAIINATNERLQFSGGVSKAIADAAGSDFEQECKKYIDDNGPIAVSEVCVTGPGKLPCDMVIHAVGPRWDKQQVAFCKKQLYDTYENILKEAEGRDCKEIAVPAISSGIFGMPPDICIDAYSRALIDFDKSNPGHALKKVHFVDIKDDLPSSLAKALNRHVSSGTARSGSPSSSGGSRSPSPVRRRSPSPMDRLSSFTSPYPGSRFPDQ